VKLDAKQLRVSRPTEEELAKIERRPIYIVLDNVLDTYNIGSIFRLADAVAACEVILCGGTERPPSSRIHKAAVGTEEWVPWRYEENVEEVLQKLKADGVKIVVVEQDSRAIGVQDLNVVGPVAFVVGHETTGVSKAAMDAADIIVEIPMWGVNRSLNVHVSAAVVIYKIMRQNSD
jgi:tRNA G18 (ribose-2'-O)-methylase SpoU